jgi:hypothetical protein
VNRCSSLIKRVVVRFADGGCGFAFTATGQFSGATSDEFWLHQDAGDEGRSKNDELPVRDTRK